MLRFHLIILISHSLIFVNSCKKWNHNQDDNSLKVVKKNEHTKSINEKLHKRALEITKEKGQSASSEFVIVNHKTNTLRPATPQDFENQQLGKNEKIYYGTPFSKKIIGINFDPENLKKGKVRLAKYLMSRKGVIVSLKKIDGIIISAQSMLSANSLKNTVNLYAQKLKDFLSRKENRLTSSANLNLTDSIESISTETSAKRKVYKIEGEKKNLNRRISDEQSTINTVENINALLWFGLFFSGVLTIGLGLQHPVVGLLIGVVFLIILTIKLTVTNPIHSDHTEEKRRLQAEYDSLSADIKYLKEKFSITEKKKKN